MRLVVIVAGLVVVISFMSTARGAEQPKPVDFAHDILPLLKARCAKCHTNGEYKGSFSIDTREAILKTKSAIPGKSTDSELFQRLVSDDPLTRMPSKGERLTAKEIALLKAWIDEGLKWEEGFTFKVGAYVAPLKPRRPTLPPAHDAREHPIDRIVDAYFVKNKLARPQPLDDVAFIRRLYLDVIGLLPAAVEVEAFVKETAVDKRARLIRRVLEEKRAYADHWLTFLERLTAQRLFRHRFHRRRPQANLGLAVPVAPGEQTLRSVCARVDQPDAGLGRLHQRHQVARPGQRQPGARSAVRAERRPGVLRRQPEMRLVPR